ncbi:MAG: hypothetical protein P8Y84_12685 [Desulfuromonadales bacterium]
MISVIQVAQPRIIEGCQVTEQVAGQKRLLFENAPDDTAAIAFGQQLSVNRTEQYLIAVAAQSIMFSQPRSPGPVDRLRKSPTGRLPPCLVIAQLVGHGQWTELLLQEVGGRMKMII